MRTSPSWGKHHRVIHSKYPPITLFEGELSGDDELLMELEGTTSDRLTRWNEFVSTADYKEGPGWSTVMAAFCYATDGRFSITDKLGAYYCASHPKTAMAEWCYHAAKIWNDFVFTDDASAIVRSYVGKFNKPLVDARKNTRVHRRDDYTDSQAFALKQYQSGKYGILYRSMRDPKGECAALLRPTATTTVTQSKHYSVIWDGERFTKYGTVGEFVELP